MFDSHFIFYRWSRAKYLLQFVHFKIWHLFCQEKLAKAQVVKDLTLNSMTESIENEKKEQWRTEGRSLLFDAKRVSNIGVYFY